MLLRETATRTATPTQTPTAASPKTQTATPVRRYLPADPAPLDHEEWQSSKGLTLLNHQILWKQVMKRRSKVLIGVAYCPGRRPVDWVLRHGIRDLRRTWQRHGVVRPA